MQFRTDTASSLPSAKSQWNKWKAESSLFEFIRQSFEHVPTISKGKKFKEGPHLKLICDTIQAKIEALYRNESPRDLIINVPPATMKSIMVSKDLVPWVWTWWPQFCYLIVSYSKDLAADHCMVAKDVITSDWYQQNWGDKVKLKKNTETFLINTGGGHCYSAGIDGTITGKHYHAHSYDDLINPVMARSEAERLNALDAMDNTLSNRFLDLNSCLKILTQQRLHELDPTGHVLQQNPDGWDRFCLPHTDEYPIYPPELSSLYVKPDGEMIGWLWPEHIGPDAMKKIEPTMTKAGLQAQYGQSPSSQDGEVIKKWYWRFYNPKELKVKPEEVDFFADTAFGKEGKKDSAKGKSDPNGMLAATAQNGNLYFLDYEEDHLISPLWRPKLGRFVQKNGSLEYSLVYIEPKANGKAQVDEMRINGVEVDGEIVKLNLPIMDVKESMLTENKEVRLDSQLPKIEGGRVFLPLGDYEYTFKDAAGNQVMVKVAKWVPAFIESCAKFPKGAHDEPVDLTTYACMFKLRTPSRVETLWNL